MNEMEAYRKLILSITDCEVDSYRFPGFRGFYVGTTEGVLSIVLNETCYEFHNENFPIMNFAWDEEFSTYLQGDIDIKSHLDDLRRMNEL